MRSRMIAIIDFGMGNVRSVQNAFSNVGFYSIVTDDIDEIKTAKAIVLPGVGAFRDAITVLRNKKIDKVIKQVIKLNKPLLGICLGMQLLLSFSEEGGKYQGLNILSGRVKKFPSIVKSPQMGWNSIRFIRQTSQGTNLLFKGIPDNSFFYFVHSFYCQIKEEQFASSITHYGINYVSSIRKKNLFGVQFHPEKSSQQGLKILKNFGDLN